MEQLESAVEFFLRNSGHKGYPFLRYYIRAAEREALKTHTQEEVEDAIKRAADRVSKQLNIDVWLP